MKIERIIVIGTFVLLAVMAAISAYLTAIEQTERKYQEIIEKRDRIIKATAIDCSLLRAALEPKPYIQPIENMIISSGVGIRVDPMGGTDENLHKGVDLAAAVGTPVRAVLPGRVVEHWLVPGWHYGKLYRGDPIFGGKIVLDHGDGMLSIYGHLSKTFMHTGDWVEMGQVIGEVGNTGISTGAHLHFEVVVNPLRYLKER